MMNRFVVFVTLWFKFLLFSVLSVYSVVNPPPPHPRGYGRVTG